MPHQKHSALHQEWSIFMVQKVRYNYYASVHVLCFWCDIIIFYTRGKCGFCTKGGFLYFSPNFSTQMNVSLPFEGHNVAYQCKGLDQSNIVSMK